MPFPPAPSRLLILLLALTTAFPAAAANVVVVPPGNRSATQPDISHSSVARTAETGGDFETKYQAIHDRLAAEPKLLAKIESVAAVYGIDPVHIVGAIVGEHTYNVDVLDNLQSYYVKALSYLNEGSLKFAYQGETIDVFVARPEFEECADGETDYDVWSCRDRIWRTAFRGQTVDGIAYPDDRFEKVFFQPFFAGQTFGLGQLNPLAALMVSDVVHEKGKLPVLDMRRAPEVYRAVMDPDMTLHYMAATIANDIAVYRDVASVDISGNPGITATLYNVGQAAERAGILATANKKRRAAGQAPLMPQENYYGWLVNDRIAELEALFEPAVAETSSDKPASEVGKPAKPQWRAPTRRRKRRRKRLRLTFLKSPTRRLRRQKSPLLLPEFTNADVKRAAAAVRRPGFVETDDDRTEMRRGEPHRHDAAKDTTLALAAGFSLAGDDQHDLGAVQLCVHQETAEALLGGHLGHAVQINPAIDRNRPASKTETRATIDRRQCRGFRRLRRW